MEANSSKITKYNKIYTTLDILQKAKPNQAIDLQTKVCTKCRTRKNFSEFYKRPEAKDGLRSDCKDCRRSYDQSPKRKAYHNSETRKESKRAYDKSPERKEYHKANHRVKRKTKLSFRLRECYKRYCRESLKSFGMKIDCSYLELLGLPSWQDYADYIEKLFYDHPQTGRKMSIKSRGYDGWHIDHIRPISSAKTEEDMIKIWHYTNLQALWSEANIAKGSKFDH